ncbi:nucleoside hydrolase [Neptunomonas phycophila]|uniref:nucleoside hydrolase n=1 Tax=Neptunomonas phycophila TaxID=1572645 RepID=UPI001BEC6708|nr:nucleoside hydrolase [Neptunomonas phycophila]MBT3145820.1 nucleoside hydrolase [Neptunomonas phycophila]MDO6784632.1 nucleoside hydrolase [Neptunomonas phycophila]
MSHKMILDTDPGIDDAMAIFTAMAHPEIELLGLTTTFGNVSVAQATQNALTLVEMAGLDIPVAQGVSTPWVKTLAPFPDFVHGADGFGNLDLEAPKRKAVSSSAAEFIVEQVNRYPHEISLVAVGPLGNLATALKLDPSITSKVKQVVIMGGAIATDGNVSPVAEANILSDPHAAEKVMAAHWPVVIVGLDVTHQVVLSPELFDEIRDNNPKVGQFMHDAAEFYTAFYSSVRHINGCYAHDVSAVAYVVEPDIFGTESGEVCVATEGVAIGQTIMSRYGIPYPLNFWEDRPKQTACMTVDDQRLITLFKTALTNSTWQS